MVHSLTRRTARFVAGGLHALGALAFPSECVVCAGALERPLDGPVCPGCLSALAVIERPGCPRCGLPYGPGVAPGLCGPCRDPARPFRRARALALYDERLRLCLHAMKFDARRRIAALLGRLAADGCVLSGELHPGAAVVPVPLSAERRRERGYNQAELIARAVARRVGVPVAPRALVKPEERPPQSGLTASARRRNARSAYRARLPEALEGAHLLLVDDLFTTGATVEAAAGALLASGVASVDVLTLGRVP